MLATERVLTSEIDAALRLLAEAIRASAPTPEYVAGWLARGKADAKLCDVLAVKLDTGAPNDADRCAEKIRALAPPGLPVVIEENLEGGGVGLVCRIDPEGFPTLSSELRAALIKATEANNG